MKTTKIFANIILISFIVLFYSCNGVVSNKDSIVETGTVSITIADGVNGTSNSERTIFPNQLNFQSMNCILDFVNFTNLNNAKNLEEAKKYVKSFDYATPYDLNQAQITLEVGTWGIFLSIKNNDEIYYTVRSEVEIEVNKTASVSLDFQNALATDKKPYAFNTDTLSYTQVSNFDEVYGNVNMTVYFRSSEVATVKAGLYTVGLVINEVNGYELNPIGIGTITSGTYENYSYVSYAKNDVPAGFYILRFKFYDSSDKEINSGYSEVISVINGRNTFGEHELKVDFNVEIATAKVFDNDEIKAYCIEHYEELKNNNMLTSRGEPGNTFGIEIYQSLITFEIPTGYTSIGDYTFGGCTDLKSIIIPEGITKIGNSAFYGCNDYDFTEIELPSTLNSIGDWAFLSTFIRTFTMNSAVPPSLGDDVFDPAPITIKVPAMYLVSYNDWKEEYSLSNVTIVEK